MLEIKNISFTYTDTPVIEDVSFTIAKGQIPLLLVKVVAEKVHYSN